MLTWWHKDLHRVATKLLPFFWCRFGKYPSLISNHAETLQVHSYLLFKPDSSLRKKILLSTSYERKHPTNVNAVMSNKFTQRFRFNGNMKYAPK